MKSLLFLLLVVCGIPAYGQCPNGRCPTPQSSQWSNVQYTSQWRTVPRAVPQMVVSQPVVTYSQPVVTYSQHIAKPSTPIAVTGCPCSCANCVCNVKATVTPIKYEAIVPSCSYVTSPVPSCNYAFNPAPRSRGHWTYPGTIAGHLQSGHGVNPSGMSREQMLSLHDALHEN